MHMLCLITCKVRSENGYGFLRPGLKTGLGNGIFGVAGGTPPPKIPRSTPPPPPGTLTQTFAVETKNITLEFRHMKVIFFLVKPWVILLFQCRAAILMWCSAEIWKFKRSLQQNEERCGAKRKSHLWLQALNLAKRGRDSQVEVYEKRREICHLVIENIWNRWTLWPHYLIY